MEGAPRNQRIGVARLHEYALEVRPTRQDWLTAAQDLLTAALSLPALQPIENLNLCSVLE